MLTALGIKNIMIDVLILILLEMRLLVDFEKVDGPVWAKYVLILILLEMRLLAADIELLASVAPESLNPYSTGNEVVGSTSVEVVEPISQGLNPYSTGNEVVGILFMSLCLIITSLNPYSTGNEVVGAAKAAKEAAEAVS